MEFFTPFYNWLNGLLARYIQDNFAQIATAIQPALVTLGTLYVLIWGLLQIFGRIEEPMMEGLKRIAMLALILGVGLHMWLYGDVIVDTFFAAPAQLGRAIIGAYEPVGVAQTIMDQGSDTAELLLKKGGVLDGNLAFYIAGVAVYVFVGVTAVYTTFLLALSRIALSVLLALGPLFIALLFFNTTRRFVEAWIAQLANFAFIAILAVLVAALMLVVIGTATTAATAKGGLIEIVDAVRVCLAAGLTLLVMRQVPSMAAGLASGIALSSFGVVSGVAQGTMRHLGQFARGLAMDKETSRWDSVSRKSGYYAGKAARAALTAPVTLPLYLRRRMRRNTIQGG
ncbi:MAG: type IV secretion system protein [Proteobacteria bacterium]|nr:type IV secretion system protein [Pseudomonadota bacterium]